jgi:hypothetical protein
MAFETLESLSLPGSPGRPNEDSFASSPKAALVMDGATGLGESLMPGDSDAAWLARFGAERLMFYLRSGLKARTVLNAVFNEVEHAFVTQRKRAPKETYEIPFASMMLIASTDSAVDALWYGDCAALLARPGEVVEVVGEAIAKRTLEAERVAKLAASHGLSPAAGFDRPQYLSALRGARNTVNSDKGGWLFGPDARAADHVSAKSLVAPVGTRILLLTDGFLALASDYRRYDAQSLMEAATAQGLEALGRELREIENADVEGRRYPRFKTSDDATALLLRLA